MENYAMTTYININGDVRDAASLTVPTDRTFRGAWQFNGNAVEVDMAAARDIHKDNLRAERKPRLEALDVAYMKALEAGTGATEIATQGAGLGYPVGRISYEQGTTVSRLR
jgi:hypothetical protein